MKISGFSAEELARFKQYQRRSFEVLEQTGRTLRAGETEKDVARRIRKRFHELGVHHYFHVPVVMFGDRTAYPGNFGPLEALSTDRRLAAGMPVLLDAAPVFHGYTVDTSLALAFGENTAQRGLMQALRPLRDLVLRRVRERASFRAIVREVDAEIRALGCENCHRKHIGAVLGHRVTQVPDRWLHRRRIWGLGVEQAGYFVGKTFGAQRFGGTGSPNWNHSRSSDHAPTPGLWAVEPHLARDGVGAKFEEILVITDADAYWLDDDAVLPHQRLWLEAA